MSIDLGLLLFALTANDGMKLQSILDDIQVEQQVPGISAVVTRDSEVVFSGASGVADLETGRPMTPDTILYAGSLSKIFTAVLALQLIENGELSLDDVVPGIATQSSPPAADIRVSQLLAHTSGLEREGNFGYWFDAKFPDDAALSHYLETARLRYLPGESAHYSNIGYAALGPVIARASGQSYHAALQNRVLQPLGMKSSGTLNPGATLAAGYTPPDRVVPNADQPFAGLGHFVGSRRVREYHNANAMTPAFGAFSSANDLGRLARMLLGFAGVDVLSADMRSKLLAAHSRGRGLSIRLEKYKGRSVARHGGWFAAHRTHLLLDLGTGIAVVVMANSDNASPETIAETLLDSVLADSLNET